MCTVSNSLTRQIHVVDAQGNPKVLWVDLFVPHQELCSNRNVSECPVVDISTILKCKQILLAYVTCTLNETHPAGVFLVSRIQIVEDLSIFVDLE